jgi:hypothetical protein
MTSGRAMRAAMARNPVNIWFDHSQMEIDWRLIAAALMNMGVC